MGRLIRPATPADVPEMVRMAAAFMASSGAALPFDPDYVAGSIRRHMVTACTLSLVLDDDGPRGLLCAAAVRSPLAPVTIAEELVWWIDPAHRGRSAVAMLDAFEKWAVDMGCAQAGMVALAETNTAKLYARRGYRPVEARHIKVF